MNYPYEPAYFPPAPVLTISLAYPGEAFQIGPLPALVDTGSDVSFVPIVQFVSIRGKKQKTPDGLAPPAFHFGI